MSQYLLAVHYVEGQDLEFGGYESKEAMEAAFAATEAFNQRLQADGTWVFGGGLQPPDVATVVDATGDRTLTTDGPFAEAKEHIAGFWVLEAPDLDAALKLAEEASAACGGPVEVRPFQDGPAEG